MTRDGREARPVNRHDEFEVERNPERRRSNGALRSQEPWLLAEVSSEQCFAPRCFKWARRSGDVTAEGAEHIGINLDRAKRPAKIGECWSNESALLVFGDEECFVHRQCPGLGRLTLEREGK